MSPFRTRVPQGIKPVLNSDEAVGQRVRTGPPPPRKLMILDRTSPLITGGPATPRLAGVPNVSKSITLHADYNGQNANHRKRYFAAQLDLDDAVGQTQKPGLALRNPTGKPRKRPLSRPSTLLPINGDSP